MNALFVICGLGIVSLLAEIANLKKWLTAFVILGLALAAALLVMDWNTSILYFNSMLIFDNFSIAFISLIVVVAMLWYWMSLDFFKGQAHQTDRSALILFILTGAAIMISFHNMSMLFLGIEVLSLSLYVLTGSSKENLFSTEASFKYFLMGSFATGFLLFGMALVYGATRSFDIAAIADQLTTTAELPSFFYAGVIMMFIGMAFKISAVPFHFWAPDVYEGSPTAITAFMSTIVKIAAFGAFYRLFSFCFSPVQSSWIPVVQVITMVTLVVPNVTAVYQSNVKRMLAYSSVGHVGYLLLAFVADSSSPGAILYYLASYSVASIAAFTVLQQIENATGSTVIDKFKGLNKRNPTLAIGMTIALLSLAGIPPLAGFFGKYMVFAQALSNNYLGIVVLAIGTSLVGVFYYFRVIIAMYSGGDPGAISLSGQQKGLVAVLALLTIALGLFPDLISVL